MQAQAAPHPEDLRHLLIHLAACAMRLIAPAFDRAHRTQLKLRYRFVSIVTLATQLIHQLPKLAATLARRRNRPASPDRPERPEPAERPERPERPKRPERFSLARPIDVPALVDRICRELLAIAELVGQDAPTQLNALVHRARRAAQSWPPTARPNPGRAIPEPGATTPKPSMPKLVLATHADAQAQRRAPHAWPRRSTPSHPSNPPGTAHPQPRLRLTTPPPKPPRSTPHPPGCRRQTRCPAPT